MRNVAWACVLLGCCSGCRALANREGLTGAAREVRGWAAALTASPDVAAVRAAGEPHLAPPSEAEPLQPEVAAAPRAQPVSLAQDPTVTDAAELERLQLEEAPREAIAAEEPVPTLAPDEPPSEPASAQPALLLQPPRLGAEAPPGRPTAHPTPARSNWRVRKSARAPSEDQDPLDERRGSEREALGPIRPRRLPQPPIPLPEAEPGGESALTWRKPLS